MPEIIEYRVCPVTRYIVTRYSAGKEATGADGITCYQTCGSECLGEFDNEKQAVRVAEALHRGEPGSVIKARGANSQMRA